MNMIDMLVNSIVSKVKQTNDENKTNSVNITSTKSNDGDENQQDLQNTVIIKGVTLKVSDIENRILDKYSEELKDKPIKDVVKTIVRAVFDEISEALANKEAVQIYKFGKFYPKFVSGREGFNHATGKSFVSSDKYVPKFEPSDVLKEKTAPITTGDAKE